jgi:hypothetical protein
MIMGCCTSPNKADSGNVPEYVDLYDDPYGFLSTEATFNDSAKGVVVLDNGSTSGIIKIDSTFFYRHIDTTHLERKKLRYKMFYWRALYSGNINITIGGHRFSVNEIEVYNLSALYKESTMVALIGVEAFENKISLIDFETGQIAFVDTLTVDTSYVAIPLLTPVSEKKTRNRQRIIAVNGFYDKKKNPIPTRFLFDLGCSATGLRIKNSILKKIANPRRDITERSSRGHGGSLNKDIAWRSDSLSLANFMINNLPMRAYDPEWDPLEALSDADGLMGLSLLRRFNIMVDYRNNILYVKKNNMPSTVEINKIGE